MEDVAAGHAELGLDFGRRQRLEAQQAILDRLGQRRVERGERGGDGALFGGGVGGVEQPGGHVKPEQGERVHAGFAEVVTEDARISQ